ncbi:OLC1v1011711C1 [Oldenlandia corymbosa var. corymbosa]|uniref:OLC1v1011711C1 n=1 Tax=Oldenlandia corymbosa var. corymbosa TaxID=529605 RepID=A0AAV1DXL9_OLDCO|nr:OLC1v1011711C1 [Oldenlandia corymbosa var. corymbosa]
MDHNASSPKPSLSPSSDPEEKEISEDDDDDRNHKHRRRETRSQSLEGDVSEQVFTRSYRKRNRPFENGHPFRDSASQYNETWKNHNTINEERDSSGRFDKRRQHAASFARTPFDLSQRRGRGRESSSWNQRDSRFNSVDLASQLVQPGSIPPNLFAGRGLPNVANMQNASWNAFGLIPAIPNGGLENLHTIGMPGALNTSINPPLSLGIPRARCRDFEERGFCLRGDMCPMEHGVHRIVVEDVQSLSQFNLPVSLPGAHMLVPPGEQGPLPANAPSGTLMNTKSVQTKSKKSGVGDDGLAVNGAGGSDFYDPDQPLWAYNSHDASPALPNLNSSNADRIDPLSDHDNCEHLLIGQIDSSDHDRLLGNLGSAAASQSSSVWGRINSSKNRSEVREKIDFNSSPGLLDNERKDMESSSGAEVIVHKGKLANGNETGSQVIGLPSKAQSDSGRTSRKPSQKALRTLYVGHIPLKDNKREALFSHFRKFGEVIDIYIPSNSDRAFVQFSKREEAEAALKAPDAVMGNRFIKLFWANRDSIPDDGSSGVNLPNVRGVAVTASPTYPLVTSKGKDNVQISASKNSVVPSSTTTLPRLEDNQKPLVTNGAQATPPLQKKLESLELLKEELRKKQEMLDQKRSEFKRHLNKLEKQAGGKDDLASDPPTKRHKGGLLVDVEKIEMSRSSESGTVVASPQKVEVAVDSGKPAENSVAHGLKPSSTIMAPDASTLRPLIRPLAPVGAPFVINRFKLDNRPTAFRILPPLPSGLANVSALKDHFSTYGDLSLVEVEDIEPQDNSVCEPETSKISARISFTNRRSAERAFLNGKSWQGENLQFKWLMSSKAGKEISGKENPPTSLKSSPSDANIQSSGEVSNHVTGSSDVNIQSSGEVANHVTGSSDVNIQSSGEVANHETASSGNNASEERSVDDAKSVDQVGDLQSC